MQLDNFIGGRIAEFQQKLANVFSDNGKGLTAHRVTTTEAAEMAKAAQEAGDAVEPTVAYFEAMSTRTRAESRMTVAALGYVGEEATAFVETLEKAVDTAEVMDSVGQRTAITLKRYQASRERMRGTTAALAAEFTDMMAIGQNQQRAIAPTASGQKRFTPSQKG